MIFNTFDSDIDKWTSKIGVLGKSFDELGTAISDAFDKAFGNFGENASFWKTLKDNLSPKDENGESWTKNKLGEIISPKNIDTYIKDLDIDTAKKELSKILAWDNKIKNGNGKTVWEDYFKTLKNGSKKYIPDLIKNTQDLSKLTSQDLVNANQAARNAVLAHNAALQKQTVSAKAGKIAMKGLALAGNVFVDMLIAKGIELAVTALDRYINRVKYAKEEMEQAQQTIDEAQKKLESTDKTIKDNRDRFLELSKGVSSLSENKTLSDDDYAEFLSISQEIAEISPDLIAGYDEQGKALLRLGENAEETEKILDGIVESQKKVADKTLIENMDKVATGVKYSIQETQGEIDELNTKLEDVQNNTSITGMDIESSFLKDQGLVFDDEQFVKYGKQMEQALKDAGLNYETGKYDSENRHVITFTDAEVSVDKLKKAQKYFDLSVEMQNKAYSAEEAGLKKDIAEKEKLIEEHYQKMTANLKAWVKNNYKYQSLNETNQSFVDKLIPSIDWGKVQEEIFNGDPLDSYDYQRYIEDYIVAPLVSIPDDYKDEVNNMISRLLKFEEGDLDITNYGKDLQNYLKNNIDENIDISAIYADEQKALNKLEKSKEKEKDFNWDSWFAQNSIDTVSEVNKWLKIANAAETAAEARRLYAENNTQPDYSPAIEEMETSLTSLSEAQELFNTALSEQAQNGSISEETIASLRDKYEDLDKVLEITTNGVVINRDKLAELNAEEEKSLEKDLTSTREELVDQYNANSLAIAYYKEKLKDGTYAEDENEKTIRALLDAKREDQKQTEEQLSQLDLLGVKYDELTSKSNKFLQSLSSADDGAIYDSVYAALEQVKQVYDAGDYGKDEFRNFVDYMTFDDMSTASIKEVEAAYKGAMKTAQRYFTENNKGMKNFTDDLKKLKVASRDANGNWTLNIENMDKLSKKLGISSDAAKDLLDKLKDKGWEINYTTSDDGLVDVEKELDKLNKKKKELNKKLKLETDKDAIAETKKQIEEVDNAIKGVKSEIKLSADTEKARTEILSLQKEINGLSGTYVDSYVKGETNVDRYVKGKKVKELQKQQKAIAKEYNIDLNSVLNVETEEANGKIDETQKKAEEEQTMVVTADTNPAETAIGKVTKIFDKVYDLKIGIKIPQVDDVRNKVKSVINKATGKKEDSKANGTVITGKAYANGKRGKIAHGYKSKALVGELGAEMRVRDGKYEILGENGAEFTDVRPDDIIFNAKQTEEILKNGKTNARGNAYAKGANGGGFDIKTHTTSQKSKDAKKKKDEEKATEKAKKATEKFNEVIDWCANSISNLSRTLERLSSKLENTSSWDKQLKIQDKIIAQQKKLVAGYSKSATVYKKEYSQSLKDIKNKKKRSKYQAAIESGKKFSVQDFSSETLYNKVIKAQEAYNTWQDAVTQKQEAQYKLAEERMNKLQIKLDKQTTLIEKNEARLNASNTSDYKTRNKIIETIIKNQKESYRLQIAMAKTDAERIKLQNELKAAIAEYKKQQFDNIQTKYDNASNLNRTKQSRIQSQIDLKEAKGEQVGTDYYKTIVKYNNSDITRKEEEVTALQKSLNASVKNGSIEKYSQEWYDMTTAIYEAQNAIDDLEKSNIEANNSLKELADTRFENLITQFDRLQSNMSFMSDLLDYEELYDDDGKMTDAGIAKMGLMFSNLQTQKNENDQLTNRMDDLQTKIIQAGRTGAKTLTFEGAEYSIEQAKEKLAELNNTAQDGISDYKALEKSIGDFLEEGIQAQIDAYNELIDAKKEALDADQDLYEFQKKMKESTQDIVLLERQLAALNGDDSDEARKKRRQLEKQLKDAKESQSDDLRNRAIDMQKENLDKQAEKYQKDMQEKIKNISDNFDEYIDTVNQNSSDIKNILTEIAGKYGYTLPTDISQIFNGDKNPVSNPNSTTHSPSATKDTTDGFVQTEKNKNEMAEYDSKTETEKLNKDIKEVVKQEVDKTTALKQKVNNIVQRGSTKSVKKMSKKEKEKALKGETELNKYLIEKKSKKLSASLQLELAKALGFKKLTTKTVVTDKNSKKIKDKLKKAKIGYAKGGYVNTVDLMDVAKSNGDTGWISAKNGEYVLTKAQTNGYLQLAKIAPEFVNAAQSMMDNINLTTNFPSYLSNGVQPQSVDNSVNITVEGNADTTTVNDIRRIAEDVVNKNQANLQRMAHNKGARISPWKR